MLTVEPELWLSLLMLQLHFLQGKSFDLEKHMM